MQDMIQVSKFQTVGKDADKPVAPAANSDCGNPTPWVTIPQHSKGTIMLKLPNQDCHMLRSLFFILTDALIEEIRTELQMVAGQHIESKVFRTVPSHLR